MKVSVIIPFYKVAPFIGRCAESLLGQTLQEVEFLFVDDASPDGSRQILEGVLAKYPHRNARIITHPVNQGLPAARNTGLAEAKGEFIYHCDSDDWVEPDMLEKMYAAAVQEGADFVYCDFYLSFETGERYMGNPDFTDPAAMLRDGFLAGSMKYNVWNKLIRRSVYEASGVLFPAGHSMGEDMTVMMFALDAHRTAHVKEALYHYVKLNANAYSNTFSQRHLEDIRFNAQRTLAYLEQRGVSDPAYLAFFQLNLKLPFLFSEDRSQYALWKEWFPEADAYVMANRNLPLRTRLVQWFAARGMFRTVRLYTGLVNKVYYGLRFRK